MLIAFALLYALPQSARAAEAAPAAEAGKRHFTKCMACHSLESGVHMTGPSLARLSGRKAGSAQGFVYSPAMQQSDVVWTRESLSAYLDNPATYIPGNLMPFGGLHNREQREALVDYLLGN